jgi:hypothetical protein
MRHQWFCKANPRNWEPLYPVTTVWAECSDPKWLAERDRLNIVGDGNSPIGWMSNGTSDFCSACQQWLAPDFCSCAAQLNPWRSPVRFAACLLLGLAYRFAPKGAMYRAWRLVDLDLVLAFEADPNTPGCQRHGGCPVRLARKEAPGAPLAKARAGARRPNRSAGCR